MSSAAQVDIPVAAVDEEYIVHVRAVMKRGEMVLNLDNEGGKT